MAAPNFKVKVRTGRGGRPGQQGADVRMSSARGGDGAGGKSGEAILDGDRVSGINMAGMTCAQRREARRRSLNPALYSSVEHLCSPKERPPAARGAKGRRWRCGATSSQMLSTLEKRATMVEAEKSTSSSRTSAPRFVAAGAGGEGRASCGGHDALTDSDWELIAKLPRVTGHCRASLTLQGTRGDKGGDVSRRCSGVVRASLIIDASMAAPSASSASSAPSAPSVHREPMEDDPVRASTAPRVETSKERRSTWTQGTFSAVPESVGAAGIQAAMRANRVVEGEEDSD